ncbi:MAG: helix-turn-helix transcriptional regulator [Gemmatimonadota bacterium]|jgi:DNA-binding PadR family transcriptional regulator
MSREHLGEFEHLLLLAVLRTEPEAYGAALRRALAEHGDRRASLGAIYSTVRRLEGKGLVETDDRPSPRGGRPRRYVTVTSDGMEVLRNTRASLERMAEGLTERLRPGEA